MTGHPIPAKIEARRAGDPAQLIASSEKAKSVLGWKPQYDDLHTIIETRVELAQVPSTRLRSVREAA